MAGETKRNTEQIQFNATGVGTVGDSKPKVIIHLVNIVSRFCYACGSPVCTLGLHTSVYWKTYSGPFWDRSTPAILVSKQSQSAARWACVPLHVNHFCHHLQILSNRHSNQRNVPPRTSPTPTDPQLSSMCRPGHLLHQKILNSAQCAAQDNKRYEF